MGGIISPLGLVFLLLLAVGFLLLFVPTGAGRVLFDVAVFLVLLLMLLGILPGSRG